MYTEGDGMEGGEVALPEEFDLCEVVAVLVRRQY